jgi:hypothetical protein
MTVRVAAAQALNQADKFQAHQGLIDVDPITCDSADYAQDSLCGGGYSETQGWT